MEISGGLGLVGVRVPGLELKGDVQLPHEAVVCLGSADLPGIDDDRDSK